MEMGFVDSFDDVWKIYAENLTEKAKQVQKVVSNKVIFFKYRSTLIRQRSQKLSCSKMIGAVKTVNEENLERKISKTRLRKKYKCTHEFRFSEKTKKPRPGK